MPGFLSCLDRTNLKGLFLDDCILKTIPIHLSSQISPKNKVKQEVDQIQLLLRSTPKIQSFFTDDIINSMLYFFSITENRMNRNQNILIPSSESHYLYSLLWFQHIPGFKIKFIYSLFLKSILIYVSGNSVIQHTNLKYIYHQSYEIHATKKQTKNYPHASSNAV